MKKRSKQKYNIKDKIIKRQINEIDSLKNIISDLEIDNENKKNLIYSVERIHDNLLEYVNDLKNQREKYDALIKELTEMRNAMNQIVFKRKWSLVKLLMK